MFSIAGTQKVSNQIELVVITATGVFLGLSQDPKIYQKLLSTCRRIKLEDSLVD